MKTRRFVTLGSMIVAVSALLPDGGHASRPVAGLELLGSFDSGAGAAGSEIVEFDARTKSMLVTNGVTNAIDVVSITDPTTPTWLRSVSLSTFGSGVQSVATHNGLGVAAVAGVTVLDPGSAVVFDIATGNVVGSVPTGVLPDSVTWSDDGKHIVIANEGEPRCVTGAERSPTRDPLLAENPEGSITVITVSRGGRSLTAHQLNFHAFDHDAARTALIAAGVRVGTWPGSSVSEDLEPEYATIEGKRAYVTLQENNAIATIDLDRKRVLSIKALGSVDHASAANAMDASDRDLAYRPSTVPVTGLRMPDAIADLKTEFGTFLLTANEGDTRAYFAGIDNLEVSGLECFTDEVRVRSLAGGLDPASYGGAANVTALRDNVNLGRLKVSSVHPSTVVAGKYTSISSFGSRSVSIFTPSGALVWDSGSLFERTVYAQDPSQWLEPAIPAWATAAYDARSDDKGVEPEAVTVGKSRGRSYAFVGLERAGGVMVLDVTNPATPTLIEWERAAGEVSPEGLTFVEPSDSPTGNALLLVANEVSGTTTVFEIRR